MGEGVIIYITCKNANLLISFNTLLKKIIYLNIFELLKQFEGKNWCGHLQHTCEVTHIFPGTLRRKRLSSDWCVLKKNKDCNSIKTSIFVYSITTTYKILLTLVDDKNDFNVIRLFGIYSLKREIGWNLHDKTTFLLFSRFCKWCCIVQRNLLNRPTMDFV